MLNKLSGVGCQFKFGDVNVFIILVPSGSMKSNSIEPSGFILILLQLFHVNYKDQK